MAVVVKIYEDASNARNAYSALLDAEFPESTVALLVAEPAAPGAPGEPQIDASAALKAGALMGDVADFYLEFVKKGYALVAVDAPFGSAFSAYQSLDRFSPVDVAGPGKTAESTAASRDDSWAAPLSSFFGLPILSGQTADTDPSQRSKRARQASAAPFSTLFGMRILSSEPNRLSLLSSMFPPLSRHDWALSSKFGMKLLGGKAAPLSSMFGMPTRTAGTGTGWTRSLGFRILSENKAPLSSFFGIPLLSGQNNSLDYSPLKYRKTFRNRAAPLSGLVGLPLFSKRASYLSGGYSPSNWNDWSLSKKFGMGILSKNPAPLSSMLNMKVLKEETPRTRSTLGLPLLFDNPAPLSSKLRLPVKSNL